MSKKWFFVFLLVQTIMCIDHLPCSEGVDAAAMVRAHAILEESTPPGYRLTEYSPITQTGRNPHRWLCRYERLDHIYRQDCAYLTGVRQSFRRDCPAGCEISQVVVADSPSGRFIQVEFLVNCYCRKIPSHRRRRSENQRSVGCDSFNFVREKSTCSGMKK